MPGRSNTTRRTVLRGAVLVPVAGLGAAACLPDGEGKASSGPTAPVELGAETGIPKGGAKLFRDENVVVSHAEDGTYTAFSTICTHAGCPIDSLEGTELTCPCHGSKFDATTGKVLHAPATKGLTELTVKVKDGRIVAGPGA